MAEGEEEQSFQQMWAEAQMRFMEKTKRSLRQPRNRALSDVMKTLEEHFNPQDSEESQKHQRLKQSASDVLIFVQMLGGITAQAAALVFGPANLCFNAMNFLLTVPTRVSGLYDGTCNALSVCLDMYENFQDLPEN